MTTSFDLTDDEIFTVIAPYQDLPGALLPMLHALQDRFGHVPGIAVPVLAKTLNLSRAEIHGVVTYYHHFRDHPNGRHTIRLCRAEACQAVGAADLAIHATQSLGCDFHQTSGDGLFSLEAAYCLGQCAVGPALLIDDEIFARVTPERFDQLLQQRRDAR